MGARHGAPGRIFSFPSSDLLWIWLMYGGFLICATGMVAVSVSHYLEFYSTSATRRDFFSLAS